MTKNEVISQLQEKINRAGRLGNSEITICVEGAKEGLKFLKEPPVGVMPQLSTIEVRGIIRDNIQDGAAAIYDAIYKHLNKPKSMYVWYCEAKIDGSWQVKMFRYSKKSDAEGNQASAVLLKHSYRNVTGVSEVPTDDKVDQN